MKNQTKIIEVQKFWDRRPCNIRHSPSKIGTKKYFDEVDKRRYFVEPHILKFAEFKKWKGKKVLEIGCGIGTNTIRFAKAGATVTACELSNESLKIAKARAKVYKLDKKIRFYQANAEKLSKFIPIESYDLIYSFGVIHHTPHPEKALHEMKKYTKRGTVIDKLIAMNSEAATGSPVTYAYSPNEARKLMKDFKVTKIKIDHIFPYSIPHYIKYQYKIVWYFRLLPRNVFQWLKVHFGWHLMIDAQVI